MQSKPKLRLFLFIVKMFFIVADVSIIASLVPLYNIIMLHCYQFLSFCCIYYTMEKGFCQALLLLILVVASCSIIPTRLLRSGVGGSVATITVSVVIGGVVGAGGGIVAVNILGAVGGVAVAIRAITIHHCYLPLSHFVVLIITYKLEFVNPFL
jgi:hypothetical protein